MEAENHFDRFQFDGRRPRAVSVESELSFNDYERMSSFTRAPRNQKYVPAWALCDLRVREVILEKLYCYARGPEARALRASGDLTGLEKCAEATRARRSGGQLAAASENQRRLAARHIHATRNGIAGLWVRVLYLAYRTRRTSPEVAAEIGITPQSVRVLLQGLNKVARKLFPSDCNPPAHDPYKNHRTPEAAAKRERRIARQNAKAEPREPKKKFTAEERAAALDKQKAATIKRNCGILRTLAEANGGLLPTVRQLRRVHQRGYEGAYRSVKNAGLLHLFPRHARANQFRLSTNNKGASQMKKATFRKHLQTLRRLARKHGGTLPTYTWLNQHGYFRAYDAVRKEGALKIFKRAHR
jgi:hypothetical protein